MATLSIQIVSGSGTTTASKTFSSTDAQRILAAYQNVVQPGGTQQNLNDWIGQQAVRLLVSLVSQGETTAPSPPVFT